MGGGGGGGGIVRRTQTGCASVSQVSMALRAFFRDSKYYLFFYASLNAAIKKKKHLSKASKRRVCKSDLLNFRLIMFFNLFLFLVFATSATGILSCAIFYTGNRSGSR